MYFAPPSKDTVVGAGGVHVPAGQISEILSGFVSTKWLCTSRRCAMPRARAERSWYSIWSIAEFALAFGITELKFIIAMPPTIIKMAMAVSASSKLKPCCLLACCFIVHSIEYQVEILH